MGGTLLFHGNPSDISHNNPYGIEVRTGGVYLQPDQIQVFFSENQIADLMTSAFLFLPNPMSLPPTIRIHEDAPNPIIACASGQHFDRSSQMTRNTMLQTQIAACRDCRVGRAQRNAFAFSCETCAPGLFAAGVGSRACAQCPQGYFGSGGPNCSSCPQGWFGNINGSTQCIKCITGQYSKLTGASSCLQCPVGWFRSADDTNSSRCTQCGAGSHQNQTGPGSVFTMRPRQVWQQQWTLLVHRMRCEHVHR